MLKKLFITFIHELEKLMVDKNKIFIRQKIIYPNSVQKISLQNIIIYDSIFFYSIYKPKSSLAMVLAHTCSLNSKITLLKLFFL